MAIWQVLKSAIVGVGVGEATADALTPILTPAAQDAWAKNPYKALEAAAAAQLVAQGLTGQKDAEGEAALTGINPQRLQALIQSVLTAPGVPEGLTLLRRKLIEPADFTHILRKAKIEPLWDTALLALTENVLSPADLALGLVRNNVRNEDAAGNPIVPAGLDSTGATVPQFPPYPIDPETEAAMSGLDLERFKVIANNVGLPPGVVQGLQMLNRGLITEADFALLVEQSDLRIAWGPFILQLRRLLLTPHNYAELDLRGYITHDQRDAGAALSGMTAEDTALLYDVLGRAPSLHTLAQGLARGGNYPGSYANVPEPWRSAIQRSNIREEWCEVVYAARYVYPSGLQVRTEAKAGGLTPGETTSLLLELGWDPNWAEFFALKWAGAATGPTSSATKSADTAAVRAVQKAYVQQGLSVTDATAELTRLGQDAATFRALFAAWDVSRTAYLQGLSNTQIKNRYRNLQLTETEAISILEGRGLTAAEATEYLTDTVPPAG